MSDYDKQVKAIKTYNQVILDKFRDWLKAAGLTENTIKSHIDNIDFFAEFLVYYEPLYKLDEADEGDVFDFLADWFPRKAAWASEAHTKSNMASFRKFFKFMVQNNYIDSDVEIEVKKTLKTQKDVFLEAVDFDDDFGFDDLGW